jgi:hypothetical protein
VSACAAMHYKRWRTPPVLRLSRQGRRYINLSISLLLLLLIIHTDITHLSKIEHTHVMSLSLSLPPSRKAVSGPRYVCARSVSSKYPHKLSHEKPSGCPCKKKSIPFENTFFSPESSTATVHSMRGRRCLDMKIWSRRKCGCLLP